MTRKTLQLRDPSEQADTASNPARKRQAREISDSRLDALHERARELRRFPSEAHKALAARFAKADLGPYKFTRHEVIGSAIVDFGCRKLGMAIAIDEDDASATITRLSDKSLEDQGVRVMRIRAVDILENMDAVLARITAGMRMRIGDKKDARREHHRRSAPRRERGE